MAVLLIMSGDTGNGAHIVTLVTYIWSISLIFIAIKLMVNIFSLLYIVIFMACKSITVGASIATSAITSVIHTIIGVTIILVSAIALILIMII